MVSGAGAATLAGTGISGISNLIGGGKAGKGGKDAGLLSGLFGGKAGKEGKGKGKGGKDSGLLSGIFGGKAGKAGKEGKGKGKGKGKHRSLAKIEQERTLNLASLQTLLAGLSGKSDFETKF
jgi:hypothetical protein